MNNITKNLLLGLTLVCVVVLIVFCIQLIVLNRGVDPADTGPGISGGSSGNENPGSEDEDEPNGDGEEDPGSMEQNTPRPPPQGTRHEIRVTPESYLVVYARDELFDFEEREIDWWFYYKGGGTASLEISYIMITPIGVAAHAEAHLNNYTGGTDAQFTGEESIRDAEIRGYHASAMHGGSMYEAWIHTLLGSDLALVFVIQYENNEQRDALNEVLSSLDMISAANATPTTPHQTNGDNSDENGDE